MTMADFERVVEAERERLRVLAGGNKDAYFLNCWLPGSGPDALLPPAEEPAITDEERNETYDDSYAELYYRRSGRFLGIYDNEKESAKADKYRFARSLLPGGVLPWEETK